MLWIENGFIYKDTYRVTFIKFLCMDIGYAYGSRDDLDFNAIISYFYSSRFTFIYRGFRSFFQLLVALGWRLECSAERACWDWKNCQNGRLLRQKRSNSGFVAKRRIFFFHIRTDLKKKNLELLVIRILTTIDILIYEEIRIQRLNWI